MPFDGTHVVNPWALHKIDQVLALLASEHQWCKGKLETGDGRRCLVGAMRAAHAHLALEPIVLDAIRQVTGHRYWRIEAFNDGKGTTHAQVLQALHQARANILAGRFESEEMAPGFRAWRRWAIDWYAALAA